MSTHVKTSNTTSLLTTNQLGRDRVGKLVAEGRFEEAKQEAMIWLDKKMVKRELTLTTLYLVWMKTPLMQ